MNHGTKVFESLVSNWAVKGEILVAANLHFASLPYAKQLEEMCIGFIGVVKQESCQYTMTNLQRKYFTRRGNFYGLV